MASDIVPKLKIGDVIFLKGHPSNEGLIKEIIKKRIDNNPVDVLYFYKVFWFGGTGNSKLYSASELIPSKRKGI